MHVELTVKLPQLEITNARTALETHPHTSCPKIIDHYKELIGLNVARGFTHKVANYSAGHGVARTLRHFFKQWHQR